MVTAAADLNRALEVAGLHGPFLMVGHSIGGLHAQVFASRYPSEVAGLVLVSSTHPDQFKIWLNLIPHPVDGEPKAITDARAFLTTMPSDPLENPERLDIRQSGEQRSVSCLTPICRCNHKNDRPPPDPAFNARPQFVSHGKREGVI